MKPAMPPSQRVLAWVILTGVASWTWLVIDAVKRHERRAPEFETSQSVPADLSLAAQSSRAATSPREGSSRGDFPFLSARVSSISAGRADAAPWGSPAAFAEIPAPTGSARPIPTRPSHGAGA
ncbi:hypothetical protein SAMN04488011_10537 [Palleronia pelagia]|uniref:Uncharacterized protein n=1 Tax=Palleronia pelagia TaxID=387096 RepID=A0A1H8HYC1_9RHOB|nr:hypothetical protein SAMN04488011_10537 [Palleronia pelagia]